MGIKMVIVMAAVLALWIISRRRKLAVMDEDVNNAKVRIGVQISSHFDALTAPLNLTKEYEAHETHLLIETAKSRQSVITADSAPGEILRRQGVISEALGCVFLMAKRHPELRASEDYAKHMNTVDRCKKLVKYIYSQSWPWKDVLPKNFVHPEMDKRRLGDVVDLFTNLQMVEHGNSKDILGNAYQYCPRKFAEQEGKLAGEFFTPERVVKTLVEVLRPFNGRVDDGVD